MQHFTLARRHGLDDALAAMALNRLPAPRLYPVADGIYIHVSYRDEDGRPQPSNGLLVVGRHGALLVDTAATPADTSRLIDKIDRLTSGAPLQVYVTEARPDVLGGLGAVHERGLASLGHETTAAAALAAGLPPPRADWQGEAMAFEVGDRLIEIFHPGAGQSRINTLVYVEDADCLFGGSLIPPWGNTPGPGGQAALRAAVARFHYPAIVVPGWGRPGDGDLLAAL